MLDVAHWLAEQGLGHHAEAFAKNGIAGDVVCDLTDADLRELGLNLGDRKRLLKAIAALGRDLAEASSPRTAAPRQAERRQLTVLFCDLVGSSELSGRLDPEEMSEVIRACHRCCADVVGRWGGQVAKYMGDGALAYFGWPRAHEDDAERAVRAGLDLTERIARLTGSDGTPLAVRAGIATGLVMVGELIGEGAAQEEAVIGETPNLAARLQGVAEPGTVVIAASTRRLVGGLFEFVDLGIQEARRGADALIINPAGCSFYSIPILDVLEVFARPIIEVHISNIHDRDELHRHSILSGVSTALICGLGTYGDIVAMQAAARMIGEMPDSLPAPIRAGPV